MQHQAEDLTGRRFHRWTVVQRAQPKTYTKAAQWQCRCDCGDDGIVASRDLRKGVSKSCGCYQREGQSERAKRHGWFGTPEYAAWNNAKQRCHSPKHRAFKDYGARGIQMCREWRDSFDAFIQHIGPRPTPKHSLDRVNNDGHYEPGNVRWATATEQNRNARKGMRGQWPRR